METQTTFHPDEYDTDASIRKWESILLDDTLFRKCSEPFDRIPKKEWQLIKGGEITFSDKAQKLATSENIIEIASDSIDDIPF